MAKVDFEAAAEVFRTAMMPVSDTFTWMLETQVHMSLPKLQLLSREESGALFPNPAMVLGIRLSVGRGSSRLLFLMEEEAIRNVAEKIMGVRSHGAPLDDIMLSAVKEVISQSMEASRESLGAFLGQPVEEEMLDLVQMDFLKEFHAWDEGRIQDKYLVISWTMNVKGAEDMPVYAIVQDTALGMLGLFEEDGAKASQMIRQSGGGRAVKINEVCFPEFVLAEEESQVTDIEDTRERIRDITLDIAVEIGSTSCTVRDILDLEEDQLLMLDKQAGAPADIIANGKFIARGDVLVMDDHFVTRITEIINKRG